MDSMQRSAVEGRATVEVKARESTPRERGSPASHAIRVLCVDDHPLVVDGLEAQFEIDGGVEVVGWLASAADLVPEVRRLHPHVVLLDIEMPGPDAFEMCDRLRRSSPAVRIIMLSAYSSDSFVSSAFMHGACGYFTKSDDVAAILAGIREVLKSPGGSFLVGPTLKERFMSTESRSAHRPRISGRMAKPVRAAADGEVATPLSRLTAREVEILRLIGKGLGRVEIAGELSRSVKTIDGHQERMMRKLGITARADLVRLAIREGISQA